VAKIGRDLVSRAGRWAILAVILGAGVFLLTVIGTSASVLLREMVRNYESTNPASATIELAEPWKGDLKNTSAVSWRPGQSLWLRALDQTGHWQPLLVFVGRGDADIEKVFPVSGNWPPPTGTLALERTAPPVFGWSPGQNLDLRTTDGRSIVTRLATVVHDPAVAPASQERTAYAYATAETVRAWGLLSLDQLKVRFDQSLDTAAVRKSAAALTEQLQQSGIAVHGIQVPPAHRHPHQGILTTLLLILGSFGLLTIVLSSLLAANAAASFFAREKKSIGILKTVGVPVPALLALVLAPLPLVGLVAVLWAVPAGLAVSPFLVNAISGLLNFSLYSAVPELWSWLIPVVLGVLTPTVLTLPRAWSTVRQPVLTAFSDQTSAPRYTRRRPSAASRWFPLLAMSLRNSGRKPGRLVLNLLLMGMGGALFLTGSNLALGWKTNLEESISARHFDWQLRLTRSPSAEQLDRLVQETHAEIEVWPSEPAGRVTEGWRIDATYPDEAHGRFRAIGVPPESPMLTYHVLDGTARRGPGEVVLNQSAKARFPSAKPGDAIELVVGTARVTLRLAGVVKELGGAAAYVDPSVLNPEPSGDRQWDVIAVVPQGTSRNLATQWAETEGLPLEVFIDAGEFRVGGTEHFALLIVLLTLMGLVTGIVGWLGVSSLLGLAVVERRREFGILRTLGAGPRRLIASLLAEAAVMLALGFGAALLLSIPLGAGLGSFLGNMAQQTPVPVMIDVPAAALWLALSLGGGLLASLVPALAGAKSAIRETLAA